MQALKTSAKPASTLPSDHAFVVQFRTQLKGQRVRYAGRIEHLASGQAAHFHSLAELQRFIAQILLDLPGHPADPLP